MAKKAMLKDDELNIGDDGSSYLGLEDNSGGLQPINFPEAPLPIGDNPFQNFGPGMNPIEFGDPNNGLGGLNLPNVPRLGGGSGGGGGSRNPLTNQDGSINWGTLLAMLAAGGGGLLNHNATQQATQQTLQGLHDTGTQVANTLGGAHAGFAPYMQAGQNALQQLSNMPPSNIAANFSPIGSGRGISLSRIARGS